MPALRPPRILLFDWHATLVDTLDAMYAAVDEMLTQIGPLGLAQRLAPVSDCKTIDDAKLVAYVHQHHALHPKLRAERRVSRTDIFEVLFGSDAAAKQLAHEAFNVCYRRHFGEVRPFETGIPQRLRRLRAEGVRLGIASNRSREFLEHELERLGEDWVGLFDAIACGDDATWHKPNPEVLIRALDDLYAVPATNVWYVGDSTTDIAAAGKAGLSSIFYNGANWDDGWLRKIFPGSVEHPWLPDSVVDDFEELEKLVVCCIRHALDNRDCNERTERLFSSFFPEWQNTSVLAPPRFILFDWHATLADTLDAMYRAVDDLLPRFDELGLTGRLIDPAKSKTVEDARLVEYVRDRKQLHPKIKADRKISRTDIFEVLFGSDDEAKRIAHHAFNECYRRHFGAVVPFEPGVRDMLVYLKKLGIRVGVMSNRDREFLEHELEIIEDGRWKDLFDVVVGGDETRRRKPFPDPILKAIEDVGENPGLHCWYVGDSTTDIISARRAAVTSVFYNGAHWDPRWIMKIFPGTRAHPHQPHVVMDSFAEFRELVRLHHGKVADSDAAP
ncbi:MAG: HAD-IA family hydrolase [Gammaproteobacteria bacterium]|jgi:phosphoglycolate phosphatase|nr:HAD-IA family hydrolase [Gammaproteobacteria bacterium]